MLISSWLVIGSKILSRDAGQRSHSSPGSHAIMRGDNPHTHSQSGRRQAFWFSLPAQDSKHYMRCFIIK